MRTNNKKKLENSQIPRAQAAQVLVGGDEK